MSELLTIFGFAAAVYFSFIYGEKDTPADFEADVRRRIGRELAARNAMRPLVLGARKRRGPTVAA